MKASNLLAHFEGDVKRSAAVLRTVTGTFRTNKSAYWRAQCYCSRLQEETKTPCATPMEASSPTTPMSVVKTSSSCSRLGQEELEQAPNSWAEGVFYLFFMGGLRLFVEHIYIYIYIVFQKLRGSCHNRPRFRARFRTPSAPILIYRTLTCGWLVVEHRLWNLCHMQLG